MMGDTSATAACCSFFVSETWEVKTTKSSEDVCLYVCDLILSFCYGGVIVIWPAECEPTPGY